MLKLRWPAKCSICGSTLPAGTRAGWDPATRSVTCSGCLGAAAAPAGAAIDQAPAGELDRGQPGASAQREYLRRRRNREARTRRRHPLIGGVLLAVQRAPRHESAFHSGQVGEESVARLLARRTAKGRTILLHDRRMPHGRGNIDHLAVTPTGVYIIDAKNISGQVRVTKPVFGDAKLMINKRNRSRLVDGLDRQVTAVRGVLADLGSTDVPVHGVFCFTKADLPLFGSAEIRGHRLHHPRAVARKLNRDGPLAARAIDSLADDLARAVPAA